MTHPKEKRRKFLLDELLPPRKFFTRMKERYDIKHIVHNFKKRGLEDNMVRMFAQKEKRTVITGDRYFVKKITGKTSVIRISDIGSMTIKEIDDRLIQATNLYEYPVEYEGKIITITSNCVNEINCERKKKRLFYKKKKRRK